MEIALKDYTQADNRSQPRAGKTSLEMAAAWQVAKHNAQMISGPVSISLNW